MLKNYLTVAFRNLIKNKVSSAINIGGLAIGMAVTILIGLWIYDEVPPLGLATGQREANGHRDLINYR